MYFFFSWRSGTFEWKTVYIFLSEVIHPFFKLGNLWPCYSGALQKVSFPVSSIRCIWIFSSLNFSKTFSMSEFAGFKNIYMSVRKNKRKKLHRSLLNREIFRNLLLIILPNKHPLTAYSAKKTFSVTVLLAVLFCGSSSPNPPTSLIIVSRLKIYIYCFKE